MRLRNYSEIMVPIEYCGNVFGVLGAYGKRPYSLNKRILGIIESIAPYVGMAILEIKETEKNKLNDNDRSGIIGEHALVSFKNMLRKVLSDRIVGR